MQETGNPNISKLGKKTQFTSSNQPSNKRGKSVSDYLKEYGSKSKIKAEVTIYDSTDSKPYTKNISIEVKGTINQAIAFALIQKSMKGDSKAMNILLERTEGKITQPLSSDPENPLLSQVTVFELPNNNR